MQHILVVEQDPTTTKMIEFLLQDQGFAVTTTASPNPALETLEQKEIDLIIVDSQPPEINGHQLCTQIRNVWRTPIIMLSTLKTTHDIVAGLYAGADDYLGKPFDHNELLARIWSLLRRSDQLANSQSNLRNSDLVLDPSKNEVTLLRTGQVMLLTPLEARLLQVLISWPGHTLTREILLIKVWGYDYDTMSNQLDVYISRLRAKIEEDRYRPRLIETVRSIGYRFVPTKSSPAPKRPPAEPFTPPEQSQSHCEQPTD